MPPDPDLVFRAGLARLLAAYYGVPVDSLRVQVIGRVLCRLRARLDRWHEGRYASETVSVGPAGQVRIGDDFAD